MPDPAQGHQAGSAGLHGRAAAQSKPRGTSSCTPAQQTLQQPQKGSPAPQHARSHALPSVHADQKSQLCLVSATEQVLADGTPVSARHPMQCSVSPEQAGQAQPQSAPADDHSMSSRACLKTCEAPPLPRRPMTSKPASLSWAPNALTSGRSICTSIPSRDASLCSLPQPAAHASLWWCDGLPRSLARQEGASSPSPGPASSSEPCHRRCSTEGQVPRGSAAAHSTL